jgi:ABC-type transport system involved in cytochrome bd biosynthesis fused ATPase/permease subunit
VLINAPANAQADFATAPGSHPRFISEFPSVRSLRAGFGSRAGVASEYIAEFVQAKQLIIAWSTGRTEAATPIGSPTMSIFSGVTYLHTAANLMQLPPPGAPEIAFAGRSNSGKSSAINALAGLPSSARRRAARNRSISSR